MDDTSLDDSTPISSFIDRADTQYGKTSSLLDYIMVTTEIMCIKKKHWMSCITAYHHCVSPARSIHHDRVHDSAT